MSQLGDATDFIEAFCRTQGIARTDALRLVFIVEELFTNTVEHGHGGDCASPVRLELSASAVEVELHYEDEAPPFDPLGHLDRQGLEGDPPSPDQPPGGLGLRVATQMAARCRYARESGRNRLSFVLTRTA